MVSLTLSTSADGRVCKSRKLHRRRVSLRRMDIGYTTKTRDTGSSVVYQGAFSRSDGLCFLSAYIPRPVMESVVDAAIERLEKTGVVVYNHCSMMTAAQGRAFTIPVPDTCCVVFGNSAPRTVSRRLADHSYLVLKCEMYFSVEMECTTSYRDTDGVNVFGINVLTPRVDVDFMQCDFAASALEITSVADAVRERVTPTGANVQAENDSGSTVSLASLSDIQTRSSYTGYTCVPSAGSNAPRRV